MYLKRLDDLFRDSDVCWRVYAMCDKDGRCPFELDLAKFLADARVARSARSLLALLDACLSEPEGPVLYQGTPVCHEAIVGAQIFEFIKGPLRLYWFYGEARRMIILAGISRKRQQTTSRVIERREPGPDCMEAIMADLSELLDEAKQHDDYWESRLRHRFAIQLLKNLKARGFSQAEFAQRAGVSAAYVSRILAGNENLSIRTLVKFTRALDLELDIVVRPMVPRAKRMTSTTVALAEH